MAARKKNREGKLNEAEDRKTGRAAKAGGDTDKDRNSDGKAAAANTGSRMKKQIESC